VYGRLQLAMGHIMGYEQYLIPAGAAPDPPSGSQFPHP